MIKTAGKPLVFLKEVRTELEKVSWPSKEETVKLTLVVIIGSLIVGVFVGGADLIITKIMELVVKK